MTSMIPPDDLVYPAEPEDLRSNEITREASDLRWSPGYWPDRVTVGRLTYRRGTINSDRDGITSVEYDEVDGSGRTLIVWND